MQWNRSQYLQLYFLIRVMQGINKVDSNSNQDWKKAVI